MYLVKNNKSPFYQIVYFVEGKRSTVSTKKTDYREAKKFLSSFEVPPKVEKENESKLPVLSEFQNEYSSFMKLTKSKSYIKSINLSFRMLIQFTGDIQICNLNFRIIDNFIVSTFSRTPRGASLYFRTLKAAFSKAVLWDYIPENPFKKIKSPKVAKSYPVFISEKELQLIINQTKEVYLCNLFNTAFYTGMRLGELVNLKWSWINIKENQITVKCSDSFTTKSKKERIIPISRHLLKSLRNHFPKRFNINNDFIFTDSRERKLNEDYVSKKFKESVRSAGLNDKIHFHSLRHSFASMLVQKGVSLYVVKELLGHEDLSTTQIYSHLQHNNLKIAVNLL